MKCLFVKNLWMKNIGAFLLPVFLAVNTADAQPRDTTTLAGRWYLEAALPSDTAAGKIPWLDLNTELSSFTGNSGCNNMHGKFYFSKTDSSISFNDKIAIGRTMCQGYNESAFLKSLKNTGRYKLQNGTLTLLGDDHAELSHWDRHPAKAPKALKT
jgi:heat shock protein HslJ